MAIARRYRTHLSHEIESKEVVHDEREKHGFRCVVAGGVRAGLRPYRSANLLADEMTSTQRAVWKTSPVVKTAILFHGVCFTSRATACMVFRYCSRILVGRTLASSRRAANTCSTPAKSCPSCAEAFRAFPTIALCQTQITFQVSCVLARAGGFTSSLLFRVSSDSPRRDCVQYQHGDRDIPD